MDIFKGQNIMDFGKTFLYDVPCKRYLSKLKRENNFKCKKMWTTHPVVKN